MALAFKSAKGVTVRASRSKRALRVRVSCRGCRLRKDVNALGVLWTQASPARGAHESLTWALGPPRSAENFYRMSWSALRRRIVPVRVVAWRGRGSCFAQILSSSCRAKPCTLCTQFITNGCMLLAVPGAAGARLTHMRRLNGRAHAVCPAPSRPPAPSSRTRRLRLCPRTWPMPASGSSPGRTPRWGQGGLAAVRRRNLPPIMMVDEGGGGRGEHRARPH